MVKEKKENLLFLYRLYKAFFMLHDQTVLCSHSFSLSN